MESNRNLTKRELKELVSKRKKKKIIKVAIISAVALVLIVGIIIAMWAIFAVRPIARNKIQKQIVGSVGEYDIYYDEFSYLVNLHKKDIEYRYGEVDWTDGSEFSKFCLETLENAVNDDIKQNYSVFMLAKKYGIDPEGKEIDKAVNDKVKSIVEQDFEGKKKNYVAWLEENNLSDAFFRLVIRADVLEQKLIEKLASEKKEIEYTLENFPDFLKYVEENDNFIRTTHVYYPKFDKYKNVDIDAVRVECENISKALKSETNSQKRLDALNDYIGKCPYMVDGYTVSTLDGLYIVEGMMGEEYETAAFALDEYGVSDVVETDYGFFVIMRLPKDAQYIDKNGENLLSNYQYGKIMSLEKEIRDSLEFKCGGDLGGKIRDELKK